MPSIHRQLGKPNWFCAFYEPTGLRRFRTTGTDNARIAQSICAALDRASRLARNGRLTNEKSLKIIRETAEQIAETHGQIPAQRAQKILAATFAEFLQAAGGDLVTYNVRQWLSTWLDGKTAASQATIAEYRRVADLFCAHLGARAAQPLAALQFKQIEDFKQKLRKRVSPASVNKTIKILHAAFAAAKAKRQIEFNPAEHIETVKETPAQRRPFTDAELRALLRHADATWRTMILLGYYTGLRLSDCANLNWRHIHLHTATLNLATQKTGRRQDIPIAEPLARHLATCAGDDPNAPLNPTLTNKTSAWLSNQFHKILVAAKLAADRPHQKYRDGRDGRHHIAEISFHSLRHNTTSALKNAGVGDSVAMDIIGHETVAISQNYTKISDAAKRAAVAKLPDITV